MIQTFYQFEWLAGIQLKYQDVFRWDKVYSKGLSDLPIVRWPTFSKVGNKISEMARFGASYVIVVFDARN